MGGPKSRSGWDGEEKNGCPCPRNRAPGKFNDGMVKLVTERRTTFLHRAMKGKTLIQGVHINSAARGNAVG
jgi:hypothetical protein